MLAGVWAHEQRREAAMRASRQRLAIRFGAGLDPIRAGAALDALAGLPHTLELVAEVAAGDGRIQHFLWVPRQAREGVASALTGVLGGVRITPAEPVASVGVTVALGLFVATPVVLSGAYPVEASRGLLASLAALGRDEQVIVRWALRPGSVPRWEPKDPAGPREREVERAWRRKGAGGGFTVQGLVLVRAGTVARARALAAQVERAVRGRRGLTGEVRISASRGNRRLASLPHTRRSSGWLASGELLALLAWPLGEEPVAGVEVGAARELLVPRHLPRKGRPVLVGRDAAGERPVALDAVAARHHMAVVGPSGVGKSVLLARSILADIEAGHGGVVIDPKADLIQTVLDRVRPEHVDRIVVLDPGDDARPVPGLSVLGSGDPDLRTEVLAGSLRSIFGDAWGVRTDHYLRLAFRTLGEVPGASLTDVARLFYEEPFRARALAGLRDPFLRASWASFAALSPAAQAEHVQAPLARVMSLLSRPRVRGVLASPGARLDAGKLLAERKWLLVSLAPGQLGESGAAIVGACLVYLVWSALEARVALAPEARHPTFLYLDELATLTGSLPFGFELAAERLRGLGAGLAVGLQTLGRIPESTRSALLGNVATLVTFRASAEEATRLARELPGLTAQDLMALARFEVAARVAAGTGSAVSVVTGRTEPLPAVIGQAEMIRERSAEVYGSNLDAPSASPDTTTYTSDDAPLGRAGRDV
jgi:hypothetical protein